MVKIRQDSLRVPLYSGVSTDTTHNHVKSQTETSTQPRNNNRYLPYVVNIFQYHNSMTPDKIDYKTPSNPSICQAIFLG